MPLLRALQADGPQAVTIAGDPETFAAGLRAQARYFKQRVSVWRVSDADYLVRIVGPKS